VSTTLITLTGPKIEYPLIERVRETLAPWGPLALRNWNVPETLQDIDLVQFFSPGSLEDLRQAVTGLQSNAFLSGVDIYVTPADLLHPSPVLVVTDVDSTLIKNEVIELIAQRTGSFDDVVEITERAMRGELDFSQSLIERVKTLRGVSANVFPGLLNQVQLTDGAGAMCRELKVNKHYIGAVSGGFIEVLQPLAESLSIDFARANELEIVAGKLTGEVRGQVVSPEVKAEMLRSWAAHTKIPIGRTVAIGDGANDLRMLEQARLGVAFNAKPIVADKADISITQGRLDIILALVAA